MTTPKQNKEALGKGIRSLLQNIDTEMKTTSGELTSRSCRGGNLGAAHCGD